MLFLLISFIAGVLTVLAPCILPVLPVIIGGSISTTENRFKKSLTIIISLGISVLLFTFLLKASTLLISIPEDFWKYLSGGIILLFGIFILFPNLWSGKFLSKLSIESNIAIGKGVQKKSFWGDVLIGAALGPVFSTCSPTYFVVLATVLPVSFSLGLIYLLAYVFGLGLILFLIVLLGQRIMIKLNIAADPKSKFKKILGFLFIVLGLMIITGLEKKIETSLINSGIFDITQVEQKLLQLKDSKEQSVKLQNLGVAPEISTPDGFINTDGKEITLEQYRGQKVVLLDIWTYSCINCQRTIPYLNNWYEKYHDQGLEIIGLHTPEFAFEHKIENVEEAVKKFEIKYPVVLDNDYSTWRAYGNKYWPRKYLIDLEGNIVYDHIGEGSYEETEKAIQEALGINEKINEPEGVVKIDQSKVKSPEIYFGANRNERLANGQRGIIGVQDFVKPENILPNLLYLEGLWDIQKEFSKGSVDSSLIFNYSAKKVYMVLEGKNEAEIEIYQDGEFKSKQKISNETLYTIIENKEYEKHVLEVKIINGEVNVYTFTFG